MSLGKVTLYIPAYNVGKYLERVLSGVMEQTYHIEEVLVIDDGSLDNTSHIATRYASGCNRYSVRLVSHNSNKGLSAARNTGIAESCTEFIASLDGDCVPDPLWLASLMGNFTNKKIAGVGGKLIEAEIHCMADRWRRAHMIQEWGTSRKINPDFLCGHSNVFRRGALIEAGGYDERLRTNGEDYYISRALFANGYDLVYEPKASVNHLKTDTFASIMNTAWKYGHWNFNPSATNVFNHGLMHLSEGLEYLWFDISKSHWDIIPITLAYPLWQSWNDITDWLKK